MLFRKSAVLICALLFCFAAPQAFADTPAWCSVSGNHCGDGFTASNIDYNFDTHELKFTGSSFTPSFSHYYIVGIADSNGGGSDSTEFYYNYGSGQTMSDPINFDVTLNTNSWRPSPGESVYLWVQESDSPYKRYYSQLFTIHTVSKPSWCSAGGNSCGDGFTASSVSYNSSTHELQFTGAGFYPSFSHYYIVGLADSTGGGSDSTEFYYNYGSGQAMSDPKSFDVTLDTNSWRPSSNQSVYVWVQESDSPYRRYYSQLITLP